MKFVDGRQGTHFYDACQMCFPGANFRSFGGYKLLCSKGECFMAGLVCGEIYVCFFLHSDVISQLGQSQLHSSVFYEHFHTSMSTVITESFIHKLNIFAIVNRGQLKTF